MARLDRLAREWATEMAQLEAAIQEARAEFEQFTIGARTGGGASLPEIQRRGADLQALSVELRERRLAHSQRTMELLTDAQRSALRAESWHSPGGRA
jgi:hypothetical protein